METTDTGPEVAQQPIVEKPPLQPIKPLSLTGTMNGNVAAENFQSAEDWLEWASQLG